MGATLLYAALLVIANFVTDLAASRLDPRIRLE
jgi:ABC-type dipeptide/oligopeptide/nickel transport system permease component